MKKSKIVLAVSLVVVMIFCGAAVFAARSVKLDEPVFFGHYMEQSL